MRGRVWRNRTRAGMRGWPMKTPISPTWDKNAWTHDAYFWPDGKGTGGGRICRNGGNPATYLYRAEFFRCNDRGLPDDINGLWRDTAEHALRDYRRLARKVGGGK